MSLRPSATVKRAAFLAAYEKLGNLSDAAITAGCSRTEHYRWLKNPEYKRAFRQAHAKAIDLLEREARRRAIVGVEEPVFHKGEVCGRVTRYSDTLLIFLLKGARPKKYRDNQRVEHSGKVETVSTIKGENSALPSREELERVLQSRAALLPPTKANGLNGTNGHAAN